MRRIAIHKRLCIASLGLLMGCSSTAPHYRNIGVGTDPIVDSSLTRVSGTLADAGEPNGSSDPALRKAYAKGNVPDSVMLKDQVDLGYRDEVVPSR